MMGSATNETLTEATIARVQRRVVATLFFAQVLNSLGAGLVLSVATLSVEDVSGSIVAGGLAQTALIVGAALGSIGMAILASRWGRRVSLSAAYGTAAVGAATCVAGMVLSSWMFLFIGLACAGLASSAGLAARFAAADLASTGERARAMGIVLSASTLGSIVGPNLAGPSAALISPLLGNKPTSGAMLICSTAFLAALFLVMVGLRPDPLNLSGNNLSRQRRNIREILLAVHRGKVTSAVLQLIVVHGVMVAMMSLTPIHLSHAGESLTGVGLLMSLHLASMYLPSTLSGSIAARFGTTWGLCIGAAVTVTACGMLALAPSHGLVTSAIGLSLLGIGWSFGLVSCSARISSIEDPQVRPIVQGASDLFISLGGIAFSVTGGSLFGLFGYSLLAVSMGGIALLLLLLPPLTSLVLSMRNL